MSQAPYVLLAVLAAAAVFGLAVRLAQFLRFLAASRPERTRRP